LWRGRLHLFALIVMVPLLIVLAVLADGPRARIGVVVYAVGLASMFAVSTTYHRWVHSLRARTVWRRADHATIYAAIAGTYTPIGLVCLGTGAAIALLVTIWTAAVAGALVKVLAFGRSGVVGSVLYIGTGWAGLTLLPTLWSRVGPVPVFLLLGGGALYTVGAIGFGRRWPTLRPSSFSYHEVWHAFTIAAAALHLGAVWAVAA
jgi:hemolysin III